MRRINSMKKAAAVVAVMLFGMTASVVGAQAAPSGSADVGPLAWEDCRAGNSCYFTNAEGGTPVWIAPSAGCFDLGKQNPPYNDRISSVWNRGNGVVNMYNWVNNGWAWVDSVAVGARISYSKSDSRNDIIDKVCVS